MVLRSQVEYVRTQVENINNAVEYSPPTSESAHEMLQELNDKWDTLQILVLEANVYDSTDQEGEFSDVNQSPFGRQLLQKEQRSELSDYILSSKGESSEEYKADTASSVAGSTSSICSIVVVAGESDEESVSSDPLLASNVTQMSRVSGRDADDELDSEPDEMTTADGVNGRSKTFHVDSTAAAMIEEASTKMESVDGRQDVSPAPTDADQQTASNLSLHENTVEDDVYNTKLLTDRESASVDAEDAERGGRPICEERLQFGDWRANIVDDPERNVDPGEHKLIGDQKLNAGTDTSKVPVITDVTDNSPEQQNIKNVTSTSPYIPLDTPATTASQSGIRRHEDDDSTDVELVTFPFTQADQPNTGNLSALAGSYEDFLPKMESSEKQESTMPYDKAAPTFQHAIPCSIPRTELDTQDLSPLAENDEAYSSSIGSLISDSSGIFSADYEDQSIPKAGGFLVRLPYSSPWEASEIENVGDNASRDDTLECADDEDGNSSSTIERSSWSDDDHVTVVEDARSGTPEGLGMLSPISTRKGTFSGEKSSVVFLKNIDAMPVLQHDVLSNFTDNQKETGKYPHGIVQELAIAPKMHPVQKDLASGSRDRQSIQTQFDSVPSNSLEGQGKNKEYTESWIINIKNREELKVTPELIIPLFAVTSEDFLFETTDEILSANVDAAVILNEAELINLKEKEILENVSNPHSPTISLSSDDSEKSCSPFPFFFDNIKAYSEGIPTVVAEDDQDSPKIMVTPPTPRRRHSFSSTDYHISFIPAPYQRFLSNPNINIIPPTPERKHSGATPSEFIKQVPMLVECLQKEGNNSRSDWSEDVLDDLSRNKKEMIIQNSSDISEEDFRSPCTPKIIEMEESKDRSSIIELESTFASLMKELPCHQFDASPVTTEAEIALKVTESGVLRQQIGNASDVCQDELFDLANGKDQPFVQYSCDVEDDLVLPHQPKRVTNEDIESMKDRSIIELEPTFASLMKELPFYDFNEPFNSSKSEVTSRVTEPSSMCQRVETPPDNSEYELLDLWKGKEQTFVQCSSDVVEGELPSPRPPKIVTDRDSDTIVSIIELQPIFACSVYELQSYHYDGASYTNKVKPDTKVGEPEYSRKKIQDPSLHSLEDRLEPRVGNDALHFVSKSFLSADDQVIASGGTETLPHVQVLVEGKSVVLSNEEDKLIVDIMDIASKDVTRQRPGDSISEATNPTSSTSDAVSFYAQDKFVKQDIIKVVPDSSLQRDRQVTIGETAEEKQPDAIHDVTFAGDDTQRTYTGNIDCTLKTSGLPDFVESSSESVAQEDSIQKHVPATPHEILMGRDIAEPPPEEINVSAGGNISTTEEIASASMPQKSVGLSLEPVAPVSSMQKLVLGIPQDTNLNYEIGKSNPDVTDLPTNTDSEITNGKIASDQHGIKDEVFEDRTAKFSKMDIDYVDNVSERSSESTQIDSKVLEELHRYRKMQDVPVTIQPQIRSDGRQISSDNTVEGSSDESCIERPKDGKRFSETEHMSKQVVPQIQGPGGHQLGESIPKQDGDITLNVEETKTADDGRSNTGVSGTAKMEDLAMQIDSQLQSVGGQQLSLRQRRDSGAFEDGDITVTRLEDLIDSDNQEAVAAGMDEFYSRIQRCLGSMKKINELVSINSDLEEHGEFSNRMVSLLQSWLA